VLIWEDARIIITSALTVDGRIIFGGEADPSLVEPARATPRCGGNERACAEEARRDLAGRARRSTCCRWAGKVRLTDDAALIGDGSPAAKNLFAATARAANGITQLSRRRIESAP